MRSPRWLSFEYYFYRRKRDTNWVNLSESQFGDLAGMGLGQHREYTHNGHTADISHGSDRYVVTTSEYGSGAPTGQSVHPFKGHSGRGGDDRIDALRWAVNHAEKHWNRPHVELD